jgi:hypothetical protein
MALTPFFVKPLAFAVAGVSTELTANPAAHLAEFKFPAMTWKTASITGTTASVVLDLGSLQQVDFVGIIGANAQAGTKYEIQMDNTNTTLLGASPTYRSGTLDFISPAVTGRALYHSHLEISPAQTRRYVAIVISAHAGAFEASTIVVGKKVSVAKYYETEWETGPLDLSNVSESRNGVPDEAAGVVWRQKSFTLGWLSESEWETSISPLLMSLGKTEPVYCCFDPDATTYRQGRTYFGRLAESRVRKRAFNRLEKQFDIRSFI